MGHALGTQESQQVAGGSFVVTRGWGTRSRQRLILQPVRELEPATQPRAATSPGLLDEEDCLPGGRGGHLTHGCRGELEVGLSKALPTSRVTH